MILRRLVPQSKIEFGYHSGKTVQRIMEHPTGKQYLRWLYFHASHIDLTQEVMNDLEIKHVLVKPGKDPELYEREYAKDDTHGYKKTPNYYSILNMIPKPDWSKTRTKAAQAHRNRTKR
jgi:hypothetical protein